MSGEPSVMPGPFSGLSIKLMATIMAVILVLGVIFYLPAVAGARTSWLEDRLRVGIVAARVLDAVPDVLALPRELTDRLLNSAGATAIVYRRDGMSQLIELENAPEPVNVVTADLRVRDAATLLGGALDTLFAGGGRTLRIVGAGNANNEGMVEVLMPEAPLRSDMLAFSRTFFVVAIIVATLSALALYVFVSRLFISPIRRLTGHLLAFRDEPENGTLIIGPTRRRDEIGTLERQLAAMETNLFSMLRQRRHLADLGLAVAKINHDLRNTLTSAQLLSDQVVALDDPKVQRLAPRLVTTLDRAIGFAQSVLDYGRQSTTPPRPQLTDLHALLEGAALDATLAHHPTITFSDEVPDGITVNVDATQMGRVFLNLLKNAREALEGGAVERPEVRLVFSQTAEHWTVSIIDNGPGLPPRARDNLFVAFQGSARAGGTGLGLAIARELTEAHGGQLKLAPVQTGTRFDVSFPATSRIA